jgi:hypothetical protein
MAKETNKFLEASLESAEVIADSLIENELIKSIPVVGTALKLISGSLDLRNKIFLSKVQRFIQKIESISKKEKWGMHLTKLLTRYSVFYIGNYPIYWGWRSHVHTP